MPDMHATALPTYSPPSLPPPVPTIPQRYGGPAAQTCAPLPGTDAGATPPSPKGSVADEVEKGWRKWKRKVKKVFSFGILKKKDASESGSGDGSGKVGDAGHGGLQISAPYGFVHKETFGLGPLRAANAPAGGQGGGQFRDTQRQTGGEPSAQYRDSRGQTGGGPSTHCRDPHGQAGRGPSTQYGGGGARPGGSHVQTGEGSSTGYSGWSGARPGDVGAGPTYSGMGRFDGDGTAVSDDGDSTWEDYEATRLFDNRNQGGLEWRQ